MRNIRIAAYAVAVLLSCAGHWAIAQKIVAAPNGVTASVGTSTLQVSALRDDILRVRMWRGSFNFSHGEYARIHLTCTAEGDGTVRVQIREQEGTWKPWRHEYRVEVVGLAPKLPHALLNGQPVPLSELEGQWGVRVPAKTSGARLEFR
jgi:Domain of unknown function (DUF5110)